MGLTSRSASVLAASALMCGTDLGLGVAGLLDLLAQFGGAFSEGRGPGRRSPAGWPHRRFPARRRPPRSRGADFLQLGASGTYSDLGLSGGGSAGRQLLGRLNPDAIQLNGKVLADQTGP